MEKTTCTYERDDGTVLVTELDDGRWSIEIEPAPGVVVSRTQWDTAYPLDLIEAVLDVKGAAWVCDEIMRDEDPGYVRRNLAEVLDAYSGPWQASVRRILDFGCGCGSSTVALAAHFPDAQIVGVELLDEHVDVARRRLAHHGLDDAHVLVSPSGDSVPDDIGTFDLVCLSAVYEHLLPDERPVILDLLDSLTGPGGTLLVFETPDRRFPIETHTSGLPLVNYLPDRLAFAAVRRFSPRVDDNSSDVELLREGVRGATIREIERNLRSAGEHWQRLRPTAPGLRHQSQIWYRAAAERLSGRPALHRAVSLVDRLRLPVSPYLTLAYRKLT